MANSFKNTSGKNTFGVFYESQDASEYIYNKKAKAMYCVPNNCTPSVNFGSERDHLLYNRSNRLTFSPCLNSINSSNLCTNLITKMDLKNVPVVQNFYPQGNDSSVPSTIINSSSVIPYLDYNIDPCGNLFGNTVCGINNFLNYKTYGSFYFSYTLSGSYYITSDDNYDTIITFTGNGTFNIKNNYSNTQINYIVVGGGGGGGSSLYVGGGGGGGGDVLMGNFESGFYYYNIIIGDGGSGGIGSSEPTDGIAGGITSFIGNNLNIVANGGQPGYRVSNPSIENGYLNGGNSGAGGLGGLGAGNIGTGNNPGQNGTNGGGGGGGQAGRGNGGNGGSNNINLNYGGGGGGGAGVPDNILQLKPDGGMGVGGGGNGGDYNNPNNPTKNGHENTGGGGGGGYNLNGNGGNGGSGVVIISFNNSKNK